MQAVTGGIGVDAVFDTVGGSRTLAAGIELTRPGGTVVLFAHAPEGASAGFDLNAFFKSERRVIATYSGALKEQAAVFDLLVSGALDPVAARHPHGCRSTISTRASPWSSSARR